MIPVLLPNKFSYENGYALPLQIIGWMKGES